MLDSPAQRKIYAVTELTRRIKEAIEGTIGWVWLEGELSNVSRPASGHLYFSLKDEAAQIKGAFFRGRQQGLRFAPKDGMMVRVYGQVSVYERSGQYQIIVQQMEQAGEGALQAAFEALKKKLAAEGLFDASRKRPCPMLPQCIGVVTSPTGAAIRDILNVLLRRYPNVRVLIAPVKVQGDGAAAEIAQAIDDLNACGAVDVCIVGRGGGSLEDLWAFNEEVVARAIARSRIPVISAVGHEIDYAISDFVADLRAPTPSAAAELVVGRKADFEDMLEQYARRLTRALNTYYLQQKNRYDRFAGSWVFREPRNLVQRHRHALESTQRTLTHTLRNAAQQREQRLDEAGLRLRHLIVAGLKDRQNRLGQCQHQLRLLSPRSVLDRGYSITRDDQGRILRTSDRTKPGTTLTTLLAAGRIKSTVTETIEGAPHDRA